MFSSAWRPCAAILLGIVLLSTIAESAETPAAEPATTRESIEHQMNRIRGNIKNAEMRFKNNVQGMGSSVLGDVSTPATECCSTNLRKIRDAMGKLDTLLGELSACHQRAQDPGSAAAAEATRRDLAGFARVVGAFTRAPTRDETRAGFGGLTRAFLTLRADVDHLVACPPDPSSADDSATPPPPDTGKKAAEAKGD